jgi:hypothetical protein
MNNEKFFFSSINPLISDVLKRKICIKTSSLYIREGNTRKTSFKENCFHFENYIKKRFRNKRLAKRKKNILITL